MLAARDGEAEIAGDDGRTTAEVLGAMHTATMKFLRAFNELRGRLELVEAPEQLDAIFHQFALEHDDGFMAVPAALSVLVPLALDEASRGAKMDGPYSSLGASLEIIAGLGEEQGPLLMALAQVLHHYWRARRKEE